MRLAPAILIAVLICSTARTAYAGDSKTNAPVNKTYEFRASDFLTKLNKPDRTLAVAFGWERFSHWYTLKKSSITNLIVMLDRSRPYTRPTSKYLNGHKIKRWDPPNPWIRLRLSDTNGNAIDWLEFYGGGGLFTYARREFDTRRGAENHIKVKHELELLEDRVTRDHSIQRKP